MLAALMLATTLATPPDTVRERELAIPGPVPLSGTLTLPAGEGPFPVVVVVHGSGPGDRDGTVGPNRPYRDIARGLAERGVAVLRYDKRSRANPLWYLNRPFTVDDEVIQDVVSALRTVRGEPDIDAERSFVLGHSLGGYLAPRIASADGQLAGLILMAGAWAKPLPELMLTQLDYIASVMPADSARIRGQRTVIASMTARINALTPADSASLVLLMGAPAAYWLDLRYYDPVEALRSRPEPALLLQGERDYQVTPQMLDDFLARLGERSNTTVKRYPGLNHLMIAGSGAPSPADYAVEGTVDDRVMADIAAWIAAISDRSTDG